MTNDAEMNQCRRTKADTLIFRNLEFVTSSSLVIRYS